ncbi:MAG: hypothetical protein V4805_15920 [Pseudomonadota bacterium]
MQAPMIGELAWYVTGRFYVAKADQAIADYGYFLRLQGIDGSLFCGAPGESTAHFTFAAEPFTATNVANGDLTLSLDAIGDFSVYFNAQPGAATFADPSSFSTGEKIAVFQRVGVVVGATIGTTGTASPIASNVFTAKLVSSKEFDFNGQRYDLHRLLPHGVTQWGTASMQTTDAPPEYEGSYPFVGSAIAVGLGAR